MIRTILTAAALAVTLALSGDSANAQFRQASPDGSAARQVRGKYVGGGDEPRCGSSEAARLYLRAAAGSVPEARRAGRYVATTAAPTSSSDAPAKLTASVGVTP